MSNFEWRRTVINPTTQITIWLCGATEDLQAKCRQLEDRGYQVLSVASGYLSQDFVVAVRGPKARYINYSLHRKHENSDEPLHYQHGPYEDDAELHQKCSEINLGDNIFDCYITAHRDQDRIFIGSSHAN